MNHLAFTLFSLVLAFMSSPQCNAADPARTKLLGPPISESTVWAAKERGIAAFFVYGLAQTTKSTLLAFSEARVGSSTDEGPHHLVLKRSTNQGATWSDNIYIEEANGAYWKQLGIADRLECWAQPTPIVDRKTGRIFLFYAFNEGGSEEENTQRFTHVFYKFSDDDGLTWSERINVTDLLNTKKDGSPNKDAKGEWVRDQNGNSSDWRGRAVHMPGPGHGLQLKSGRMLMQFWHRVALVTHDGKKVPARERNYGISLLYSDDSGQTWKAGPFLGDEFNATESRMVELDNGDIYLNMRTTTEHRGKRAIAIGRNGGLEWKLKGYDHAMPPYSPEDSGLAEMRKDGKQVLLFSHCGRPDRRQQLVLSASLDAGETWQHKVVNEGGANYSDLIILSDGRIGLLYGNAASISDGLAVKFLRIDPAWLDL
jgi:sialidase-1